MRSLIPLATLASVYMLGNALADGDRLDAALLGCVVSVGIYILARFATPPSGEPRASAHPAPANAAEDNALATGEAN